jgi:hypothetical protein
VGHYYNPPPTFVGGAQPYAPRLGVPHSASVPSAPPPQNLASYNQIIQLWWPPARTAKGLGGPDAAIVPPQILAPAGVPQAVLQAWAYDPWIVIALPSAAGAQGVQPVAPPPPIAQAIRNFLPGLWWPSQKTAKGLGGPDAPIIPPPPRKELPPGIFAQWQHDPITEISLASSAGNPGFTPSQPQPVSNAQLLALIRVWDPPYFPPPMAGTLGSLIPPPPPPSPPPNISYANLFLTLQNWVPPFIYPPVMPPNAPFPPAPVFGTVTTCGVLTIYDKGNGSIIVTWGPFIGMPVQSYNVYVNGVLNQNVTVRQALITGLNQPSYAATAVAPTPDNSSRPQNMPPTGVVSGPYTYLINVVAVIAGFEVATSSFKRVTVQPDSIELVTPMKRPFPFPNTDTD